MIVLNGFFEFFVIMTFFLFFFFCYSQTRHFSVLINWASLRSKKRRNFSINPGYFTCLFRTVGKPLMNVYFNNILMVFSDGNPYTGIVNIILSRPLQLSMDTRE